MSRQHSHIASAIQFLQVVKPNEPLTHQLKRFFASNKKYGSKDRKNITSLCYAYYRIVFALQTKSIEEKILTSIYLSNSTSNDTLVVLAPALNNSIKLPLSKKLAEVQIEAANIFPYLNHLSPQINGELFALSFLQQPNLFIRIRPSKIEEALEKLTNENIVFEEISTSCFSLPTTTKVDVLFEVNKEVVIQDKNSQLVFNYLLQPSVFLPNEPQVWDCCAASGGKSILLYDLLNGKINLHVSDVRANILNNLRNRFSFAGIKKHQSFVADMMLPATKLPNTQYDIIVCDAPCTGSGTWARTPEQLAFFNTNEIANFNTKQKAIATNALPFLKKGGLFFYITCSVFKQENEEVVDYLQKKFHLQILQMEYLKGYETKADTMFVAVLSF